jgi:hypothetical protein
MRFLVTVQASQKAESKWCKFEFAPKISHDIVDELVTHLSSFGQVHRPPKPPNHQPLLVQLSSQTIKHAAAFKTARVEYYSGATAAAAAAAVFTQNIVITNPSNHTHL